jgi:hyaluronoglucosaminidase
MKKNSYFGVIEGFYRKPYSFSKRRDLIRFLADIGLNTYVYAPKTDNYHRRHFERPYPAAMLEEFGVLVEIAKKNGVIFNYALAPGRDPDIRVVKKKIKTLFDVGIRNFSILYDDINVEMCEQTAEKQADTANRLLDELRKEDPKTVLFFCPTQYRGFKPTRYISAIGSRLNSNIKVFWTGSRIVSLRMTVKQIEKITGILKRPPLIWDNLFANDYIPPGTILRFPYKGRDPGIVDRVAGILLNPMNEYAESKPLIYSAARFFKDPRHYKPAAAWKKACRIFDT